LTVLVQSLHFLFPICPIGYGIDRRWRRLRSGTVLGPDR
jgi:hypothetical protein